VSETAPRSPDGEHDPSSCGRDSPDIALAIRGIAAAQGFALDASQLRALRHFERLHEDLIRLEQLQASLVRLLTRKRAVKGLYLWGGVGRGKSFLMDSFFSCAAVERKRRIHFHRFMQEIHHGLNRRQGQADPLYAVARDIAANTRLLCLDEFHITDITDAMLMKRLLEGLTEQGVVLVTTSNFHPDRLYEHGLQRSRFVPAIDLIKRNLDVVDVDGGTDYRLRELERAGVYHSGADSDRALERTFAGVAGDRTAGAEVLEVEGRAIRARRLAHGVVWFDFRELCDGPRAKADYIELAKRYHTVLLSGVPRFGPHDIDALRRFIWLIDEFYDRRVKLIVAARAPLNELFIDAEDSDRFQAALNESMKERLTSRLTEMQSHDYLAAPHLQ
jgi:cell division protein ZapE